MPEVQFTYLVIKPLIICLPDVYCHKWNFSDVAERCY